MTGQAPNRDGVRKSRGYAVRNTYPDLMGTTAKDWLDMYGEGFGAHRVSNGLWEPLGSPTDAWVADRCRPGRLGTGVCTVVLS